MAVVSSCREMLKMMNVIEYDDTLNIMEHSKILNVVVKNFVIEENNVNQTERMR